MKPDELPPVTPESIQAAKLQQAADRDQVYRDTGYRVDDDGNIIRGLVYAVPVSLVLWAFIFVGVAHCQSRKTLDLPSLITATGAQLGDAITTQRFLSGHGQSASHPGPCVEANPRFQPSPHQMRNIWMVKSSLIGSLWSLNYLAEQHPSKTARWISRGVNWYAASLGTYAVAHNLGHCGW